MPSLSSPDTNQAATRPALVRMAIGFAIAALAVLTFHAAAWEVLHLAGRMGPPYPLAPNAFGVPVILSLTFFGALYGIPFGYLWPWFRGPAVLWGFGLGVLACLVGWFVVAPIRGQPPVGGSILIPLVVNGVWGIGTGLMCAMAMPRSSGMRAAVAA